MNELQARMRCLAIRNMFLKIDSHSVGWLEEARRSQYRIRDQYPHTRRDQHSVNFTESAPVIPPRTFPLIKSCRVLVPMSRPLAQERGFRELNVFLARLFRQWCLKIYSCYYTGELLL
jgi:hypothetical protein